MAEGYPDRLAQRRYCDPYTTTPFGWYGNDPVFQALAEKNLKSIEGYDRPFRRFLGSRELIYIFRGLQVPGDRESHDVQVIFRSNAPAWSLGIAPCDYPAVHTSVERRRKHVHPDGGLCLWAPFDPPAQRWWHGDGLLPLVELSRRHLFFELHWWRTGGRRGGKWLGDEAPHGFGPGQDIA